MSLRKTCRFCKDVISPNENYIKIWYIYDYFSDCLNRHGILDNQGCLCDACTYDILLDGQWKLKWEGMTNFLFDHITSWYWDTTGKEQKNVSMVFNSGLNALSSMCVKCGHSNDIDDLLPGDLSDYLDKINTKYKKKFLSAEFQKNYYCILCSKCVSKYETKFINSIPLVDLPLHIHDKWIGGTSAGIFSSRLKGEQ